MTDKDTQKNIITVVQEVLSLLGIESTGVTAVEVGAQTLYSITLSESEGQLLIGEHGNTLRSLNTLVTRIIENKTNERHRISLDINDYKKTQVDKIISDAKVLADRAKELKYDVELQPSNGYERMLVHASLADDVELETTSMGEGAERRVVIKFVG